MSRLAQIDQQMKDFAAKAQKVVDGWEDGTISYDDASQKTVTDAMESIKSLRGEKDEIKGNMKLLEDLNLFGEKVGDLAKTAAAPSGVGKSLGEKFVNSPEIQAWMKSIPVGSDTFKADSPAVQMAGFKDIISSGGANSPVGDLVREDWRGILDFGTFQRPLTFREVVGRGQTTSDTVKFGKVTGFTNNAAPVAEAAGVEPYAVGAGQVQGLKPQSSLIVEEDEVTVKTIAHWVPATRRALADVAQVRTLIDNFLRYGLDEELEDQMVNGNGTGENFLGVLNMSGTQAQAWDTNLLVTTRKAKTKVRTVGRGTPTAYIFNPADNERLDLLTDSNGQFYFGGPAAQGGQPVLWGIPRIECEAVPAGVGLVADWRTCVLYDREQTAIRVAEQHADFFVRNLVAILAEMRAAFAGHRPISIVEIDLTA
jgi:HK97 family phage major capsid protein